MPKLSLEKVKGAVALDERESVAEPLVCPKQRMSVLVMVPVTGGPAGTVAEIALDIQPELSFIKKV